MHSIALACLWLASAPSFLPLVSHTWGSWWHMMFDDTILASSVYVILSFACCIKGQVTIVWGSFSWTAVRQGSGIGLGSRSNINSRFGSEYCYTLPLGSPSPWWLWFIHCVLSIVFCVTHNLQPVHIQVGLDWLILESALGSKALHQEWSGGKNCPFQLKNGVHLNLVRHRLMQIACYI